MSRVGEVVASAAAFLPGLPAMLAVPFIAAASYYLVVVNAPTPVVKERMLASAQDFFTEVTMNDFGCRTS